MLIDNLQKYKPSNMMRIILNFPKLGSFYLLHICDRVEKLKNKTPPISQATAQHDEYCHQQNCVYLSFRLSTSAADTQIR